MGLRCSEAIAEKQRASDFAEKAAGRPISCLTGGGLRIANSAWLQREAEEDGH